MSLIKLAHFESNISEDMEKDASATGRAIWAALPEKGKNVLRGVGVDARNVSEYVGERATTLGADAARAGGASVNYLSGKDATGGLSKLIAHIKRNKLGYGGAAILGAGAYGAKKMYDKKR